MNKEEDKKEIELSLSGIANLFLMGKYYDPAIQKVEERMNADGSDETSKFIATSKNYLLHALTKSIVDIKKEITRCTDKSIAIRSRANCPGERVDAYKYEERADSLKEALTIIYNYVDIANNLIVEDYKKRAGVTNVVRSGGLIITSSKEEEEDEY